MFVDGIDQASTNGNGAIIQSGDDLDLVVATLQTLQRLIEGCDQSPARLTPNAASQISRAMAAASSELRALRKESREQAEFGETMIERALAEDLIATAVGMLISDIDALSNRFPRLLLVAFDEAGLVVSDRDKAVRVITTVLSRATDEVRTRRATWIRSELGERELEPAEVA